MPFRRRLISQRFASTEASPPLPGSESDREREAVLAKVRGGHYAFAEQACAVCDGRDFDVIAERDRYGLPIQTTLCRTCGLIQTNPDMRAADYRDFYVHHYRRLYIAKLVGQPRDFFREEYWRGRRIVDYVLGHLALPPGALVVEIGCGAGGVLHPFAQRGFRVIGTDLGEENMAYGRRMGLDLRSGDVHDLRLDEQPSLVLYSHVLEHVAEPGRQLRRIRELLRSDGHLYIEVPGVKSVHRNAHCADLLDALHIAHIYNFTLRSLTNLLARHGFERVDGDETIRSIFRPGRAQTAYVTDYLAVDRYIRRTERWRPLLERVTRTGFAVRDLRDRARAAAARVLQRLGLYGLVKRMLGRSARA